MKSLAHPGGNITGFHNYEPALGGKWLEVLKEVAPSVRRVAVVHVPEIAANVAFIRAAEASSMPQISRASYLISRGNQMAVSL